MRIKRKRERERYKLKDTRIQDTITKQIPIINNQTLGSAV